MGYNGHASQSCKVALPPCIQETLTLKRISLLLFLLFFPRATAFTPPKPASSNPSYRTALLVTFLCIIHALIVVVLSLVFVYKLPNHLQTWANALGILAAVLASVQYLPQLYTTWRLQDVASLSIPMMCIQTPGSFIWAGSLASRLGVEGWSAWGLYLVTGCLQGGLLSMGIYFEVRNRGKKRSERPNGTINGHVVSEEGGTADGASEQTPLLGDER